MTEQTQPMIPVADCTGCSACRHRCPHDAIEMVEDREGFLYPRIDDPKCNQCGLCVAICPVQNVVSAESVDVPTVYAAWTTDRALLRESTSGGAFSEIARVVLDQGGVVFGAAYDEQMTVRHVAVESWNELHRLRGSKYVQSDVGDTFRQAEGYLNAGRRVLYSGTPCQVAGLYAAIGREHINLLTCDLICHGVPSPKVFRTYLESLEKRHGSKVACLVFREKRYGWLHPTICIANENGSVISEFPSDNPFSIGFYKDIYLRLSCHECPNKTGKLAADVTIGDFWELSKYQPGLINRGGTSAVIVNTEGGKQAIEACRPRLSLTQCPFSYLKTDSSLRKCAASHPSRAAFFLDLDRLSFEKLATKYMKPRGLALRHLARLRRACLAWISRLHNR